MRLKTLTYGSFWFQEQEEFAIELVLEQKYYDLIIYWYFFRNKNKSCKTSKVLKPSSQDQSTTIQNVIENQETNIMMQNCSSTI